MARKKVALGSASGRVDKVTKANLAQKFRCSVQIRARPGGFTFFPIGAIIGHGQAHQDHLRRDARARLRGVLIYCADFPRRSHRKLIAI
jgi:hypothetical protein